jgi:class 3 adenylate cyclase
MLLAWLQDNGARHPGTKPRGSSHPGSSSGRGLLQEGELSLAAKRSRFPGTPSVALAKGRGLVTLADVMVTWVVTDVEGSTRLWEENAPAMAEAVELHNKVRGV